MSDDTSRRNFIAATLASALVTAGGAEAEAQIEQK